MSRFRGELGNLIARGRAVGNLYLVVDKGPEGRHTAVLGSYRDEDARDAHLAAMREGRATSVLSRLLGEV